MVIMDAIVAIVLLTGSPTNEKPVTISNIALCTTGLIVVFILFFGCALDRSRKGISQNAFLLVIFVEAIALFVGVLGFYIDGKPEFYYVNVAVNFVYYLAPIFFAALLWFYISYQMDTYKKDWAFYAVIIMVAFGIVVLVINLFIGNLYSFTPEGLYVRKEIWPSFISPVALILILVVWAFINLKSLAERLVIIAFVFLIIILEAIQFIYDGYQLMFTCALLIVIIFYSNIYIKRGYMITEKDVEISNQRHAVMVSQIRPHFLYNVLNTIASMEDLPSIRNAIGLFGKYLRGNLDTLSITEPIPFTKELEHIRTYVSLEKIRFEDKLDVRYSLKEVDFTIPPLSVQVLVENAIRYGISRRENGGTVIIETYSDANNYYASVSDDGIGFDTSSLISKDDSNSGIDNTRHRVMDMVNGTLTVISEPGVGTAATIRIPRYSNKKRKLWLFSSRNKEN